MLFMECKITAGVSVAASGLSSWTLDIGGFSGLNVDTQSVRAVSLVLRARLMPSGVVRAASCLSDGSRWGRSSHT